MYVCIYIFIYISSHKSPTTHGMLKSCINFAVAHALWLNHTSCTQVHELPQSHRGDNWEGTLFL